MIINKNRATPALNVVTDATLPTSVVELVTERAAIMEIDGGLLRELADYRARGHMRQDELTAFVAWLTRSGEDEGGIIAALESCQRSPEVATAYRKQMRDAA